MGRTVDVSGEEDSPPLTVSFGLDNKGLGLARLAVVVVVFELLEVVGKHPSVGEEVVLFGKAISEGHKGLSEVIFPGKDFHPRKVIDFLSLVHFVEDLLFDVAICPAEIEVHVRHGFAHLDPLHLLGHQTHYSILSFFIHICLHATFTTTFG